MPPEAHFCNVSVIIPAYRAAETVGRALASVAAQTLRPKEAIVVDDGSDDGTYQAASSMMERMNGVTLTVLRQDHRGAGAARNRAVEEASGTYLAFLDADDEWLPAKLECSIAEIEGTDNVLVSHNVWVCRNEDKTLVDCARLFRADSRFPAVYRRGYLSTSTVVTRRDSVIAAGGFDPGLSNAQDFDLWLAMLQARDTPFHVFDEALTLAHVTPDSIMSHTDRRLRCCLEIANRYAPALKRHPGSPLTSLWFRTVAVHYEAINAYLSQGAGGRAMATAIRLPVYVISTTARLVFGRHFDRRAFIARPHETR